ncbi:AMY1.4 [Symbiodinium natans]|uniref:Alpha-amylase n=1 Tax=Symbiodinium natans TaxID=878477 RepID=A0A812M522_9DINO|nr:AMY1.4 [Symbiodinium natans]
MASTVAVTFNVDCEEVFVVGSHKKLGAWDVTEALPCTTSAAMFPRWKSKAAKLPNGSRIEFKVVIRGPRGNRWEHGENRLLQVDVPRNSEAKMVSLTWGQAGVKDAEGEDIVGELPTTAGEFFRRTSSPGGEKMMQKRGSRHLCRGSNGQVNLEMTRTPSLLLINFEKFNAEAALHEKELDAIEERAQLNKLQRKMKSTHLIERMAKITDTVDASKMVLLQGFNWESWRSGGGDWYSVIGKRVQMLHDIGFTDLWLPPCSQSVAPQGYLPSQLFNLDGSKYGSQTALETLLEKCHKLGMRVLADIVINHRCGDKQDSAGRWNQFSSGMTTRPSFEGVGDWGGWAVTLGDQYSDGSGMHAPGKSDGKFDAAPDIDHRNPKVQDSINIWLRWLRLQVGFDGWRFDFAKGYGAEFVGQYCTKSHPAWAVGELWTDMHYDHHGLCYNQDKHRQALVDWVNATGKKSMAFDFTTKGILQEACRLTQFWRLRDCNGKPPGLIGWLPGYAVTFIDNHDTGSTQRHWPFPDDKVMMGYAYILTHPGIPSVFWDHIMDWGDEHRKKVAALLKARRDSGIPVDAPVNIQCADDTLYLAEIGQPPALRVALGPRPAGQPDMNYWSHGPNGHGYRVWVKRTAAPQIENKTVPRGSPAMAFAAAMRRLTLVHRRRVARSIAVTLVLIAASIFLRLRRRLRDVSTFPRLLKIRAPLVHAEGTASTEVAATAASEVTANKQATPPEVACAVHNFAMFTVGENDFGNGVRYTCGEIGQLVEFVGDGDLIVQKSNGKMACWYLTNAERLLSAGDSVKYVCGEVATVVGFDADGDVIVLKQGGRKATWFAHKCA